MYTDSNGYAPLFIVTSTIGAIIGGISGWVRAAENGDNIWGGVLNGAITGGVVGLALGTGIVFLGPVIAGTATTAGVNIAVHGFVANSVLSFTAGVLGHVIEESLNNREVKIRNCIGNGLSITAQSSLSYGIGGITGSMGKIGDLNFISKEWVL